MKNYVYVLSEDGSWDYEFTNDIEVYSNFKDALKAFEDKVKLAKSDMKEWNDEAVCEQDINEESAYFCVYEDGDYTRLHDTIMIEKKEVK